MSGVADKLRDLHDREDDSAVWFALLEIAAVIEDSEEKELREHGPGCRCRRASALAAVRQRMEA